MEQKKHRSDSMLLGVLLALTGGFLDAYSYCARGQVFATAQTGNIVLLALRTAEGAWSAALSYLIPIVSFVIGIVVAQAISEKIPPNRWLHWRQLCLLIEVVVLFGVGFFPQGPLDPVANLLISFVSALQVQSFRVINGNACATTMCTGNLRSGVDLLYRGIANRESGCCTQGAQYFLLIFSFAVGAALGGVSTVFWAGRAVLLCCPLLLAGLSLMWQPQR